MHMRCVLSPDHTPPNHLTRVPTWGRVPYSPPAVDRYTAGWMSYYDCYVTLFILKTVLYNTNSAIWILFVTLKANSQYL
uniref:G_PROTEIN_RECEP_F1_2 domain-containing protein n=1 Tax=Panagrellus redivivus TaxID=6233 RepID=A0A7E4ZZD9_PANRE